jgi:hypothetical protein
MGATSPDRTTSRMAPVFVTLPDDVIDRIDATAADEGISRSSVIRRFVLRGLRGETDTERAAS